MFVPGAWWHAVINLDITIAITENVCNPGNFERVWIQTRRGRKRLAYTWLKKLKKHYPQLFVKAMALNFRDNFMMWTPHLSDDKKAYMKQNPYESDSTSNSDVSSSTSSSSSETTSDDEKDIHEIRDNCEPNEEILDIIK